MSFAAFKKCVLKSTGFERGARISVVVVAPRNGDPDGEDRDPFK
jgi:hypothetical protein